jgi:hypothetical protein
METMDFTWATGMATSKITLQEEGTSEGTEKKIYRKPKNIKIKNGVVNFTFTKPNKKITKNFQPVHSKPNEQQTEPESTPGRF